MGTIPDSDSEKTKKTKSLIFVVGKNYFYFLSDENSVARFQTEISPYYDYKLKKIPELPSILRDPFIVPRFLYNLNYNRVSYPSKAHFTYPYIRFYKSQLSSSQKLPMPIELKNLDEGSNRANNRTIHQIPTTILEEAPFCFVLDSKEEIQIGGLKNHKNTLFRSKRDKFLSAKYLSLRDFVHPEYTENQVNEQIEQLYVDRESKTYLFKLVKILYSGTPEEEQKIIVNLFRFEPEFAKFLSKRMFNAEMIPLIHGPFLQNVLKSLDERIIKYSIPKLSKPVLSVLQKSISKNKYKEILDGPVVKPQEGEDLISVIEAELYKQFSRNIYYEEGSIFTYRESGDEYLSEEIEFIDSVKVNFWTNIPKIQFYGMTQTKLFFKTLDWIEQVRFDWILSNKDWENYDFHRLPPDLILEIPFFSTGRYVVGGGITKGKTPFEFSLLWFDY